MSNKELANRLFKLASEIEYLASPEYEIERFNKIAHMVNAINGLSLIKEIVNIDEISHRDKNLYYE